MELKTLLTPFRKLLRIIWKGSTRLKSSTSRESSEAILLARYLVQSNHFTKTYVKFNAFMPAWDKTTSSFKTSVFRINGLDETAIWEIGENEVAKPRGKTLYGRGDILASKVEETILKIDYDNIPPRHANIIGWPEEKDKQKSIAQEIAAEAAPKPRY